MEQDNKKRWARLSFGVSILTIIVGLVFIGIGKTGSEIEESDNGDIVEVYDGPDMETEDVE